MAIAPAISRGKRRGRWGFVSVYGPTNGAQAVRDGTGPNPVVDPGGGISFTSRSDLQTKRWW